MLDNKGFDLWADGYDKSVQLSEEKADEDGFSIIAMWNWERKNYFIKE